jgi:hypothetical protein
MRSNSLETQAKAFQMQTVKTFIVGSGLSGESVFNLLADIKQAEIIGRSDRAVEAEAIAQLQPQVVVHFSDANEEDNRLMETIKRRLPETCYIALGDASSMMFRVRCHSAGADYILDKQSGLGQVAKILASMISKLGEDDATPRHSENEVKTISEIAAPTVPGSTPSSDLDKLFFTMDKSSFGLMFADRGLMIRHVNPAAIAIFKPLEPLLPIKTAYLLGQPIDLFHRKPAVARKIIGNPANLPYRTQIIFGPKTLDLHVSPARGGDGHYLGVMAHWTEIAGTENISPRPTS